LSEIVARPELATPVEGVLEVLAALVDRFRVVGVLTGRRSKEVAALLPVPRLRVFGLYGLEEEGEPPGLATALARKVRAATSVVPQAWVEDKGASIAVHYRQTPDPARARATLLAALQPLAAGEGLEVVEGKMVLELVHPEHPMKGGALARVAEANGLEAVLYAGDDWADLDAFRALDRLEHAGTVAITVAVRGPETPPALLDAADLVVDGPTGLVALLRQLA
jgi:trehalose 6-phosphate phosphatase